LAWTFFIKNLTTANLVLSENSTDYVQRSYTSCKNRKDKVRCFEGRVRIKKVPWRSVHKQTTGTSECSSEVCQLCFTKVSIKSGKGRTEIRKRTEAGFIT
jgi:hypothetical protein